MFTHWNDFDRTFDLMDALFRRAVDPSFSASTHSPIVFRDARLTESDDAVLLTTDLPGVRSDDVEVNLHDGVLTVQATRTTETPEGYEAERTERGNAKYARSFTLPAKVDADRTTATLEHGVLTVRMEKAADAKPRRIAIGA